jgi:RHS repeat-associated protein
VSEVISIGGEVLSHYDYTPFGVTTSGIGDYAVLNPWRYSSEYVDDQLGLVYYNFRHYNPLDGRWLTRDIMHPASDVNPYRSGYLDWLGLSEIIASTKIYIDDVNVALIALTNITETTIRDVFKWNKVEPYSKEEGRRPNKDCCEYTGKAIEYYRKLKISYKASTDPAKIKTVEWFHSSGIPEEDIALYNQLYAIVMAHEEGHISIMEKYRSKLNKDFEAEDSSCYDNWLLSYNKLESLLHDEAEAYFDKVLKEWHDVNNAYQKDEETKGRHKEFEKIKTEYDKKRKGK